MKTLIKSWKYITVVVLFVISLSGCVTLKKCNERFLPQIKDSISHEVKYLKRDSIVKIPGDSAWYKALIECMQDKEGKWIPTIVNQETQSGKRINMTS